jgi:phenol 2-monooxygenase
MTRLYVELSRTDGERMDKSLATPEYVINRAKEIMAPYRLEWKSIGRPNLISTHSPCIPTCIVTVIRVLMCIIEWFGNYVVSQRVANHFADPELRLFIAGDVRFHFFKHYQ